MKILTVKFRKPPPTTQETSKSSSQEISKPALQISQKYHKYTICSALFSFIGRLLSHSQTVTCTKASCKRCDEIFDSKIQLYEHLRNREYQQSSPAKSIAPLKSSLSALTPAESTTSSADSSPPLLPLSEYRAVSPSSSIYETTSKNYLTVTNLYMRYAPLKSVKSIEIHSSVTHSRIVLLTLSVKNLYEKFHGKESLTGIKSSDRQIGFSALKSVCVSKKSSIDSDSNPQKKNAKTSFSVTPKSITRKTTIPQSLHVRSINHAALLRALSNRSRHHEISSINAVVGQGYYSDAGMLWRKPLSQSIKVWYVDLRFGSGAAAWFQRIRGIHLSISSSSEKWHQVALSWQNIFSFTISAISHWFSSLLKFLNATIEQYRRRVMETLEDGCCRRRRRRKGEKLTVFLDFLTTKHVWRLFYGFFTWLGELTHRSIALGGQRFFDGGVVLRPYPWHHGTPDTPRTLTPVSLAL